MSDKDGGESRDTQSGSEYETHKYLFAELSDLHADNNSLRRDVMICTAVSGATLLLMLICIGAMFLRAAP